MAIVITRQLTKIVTQGSVS